MTVLQPARTIIIRYILVVILAVAFGYIEAAVVVYLRAIFHPDGFTFPLASLPLEAEFRNLALLEAGREAATLVLILAAAILSGHNRRQRAAYFMTIFAVWDIFYYVWLKVLIGWPATIMDWDVLFLIPVPWAGPVLAPVLVSVVMLVFSMIILYRDYVGNPIKVISWDWLGFCVAALIVVVSFCVAGNFMQSPGYASCFSWPVFAGGLSAVVILFAKCVHSDRNPSIPGSGIGG